MESQLWHSFFLPVEIWRSGMKAQCVGQQSSEALGTGSNPSLYQNRDFREVLHVFVCCLPFVQDFT